MKKLITFLLLLLMPIYGLCAIRNIQDNYQLIYHIIDANGDHVTGQTVVLKIKRASDGYWFDFSDSTFKDTGWISKSTNLSEDISEGYYYYTFDPPASETTVNQYIFLIDNASATYGDHQSLTVDYQNIGSSEYSGLTDADVDKIWDESQSGHITAGSFGKRLDADISTRATPADVTVYVGQ